VSIDIENSGAELGQNGANRCRIGAELFWIQSAPQK